MKALYETVRAALLTIDGVGEVGMWNSQPTKTKDEQVIAYPACFVEFVDISDFTRAAANWQTAEVTVRVHIVAETLGQDTVLEVYDLKDAVVATLSDLQNTDPDHYCTPLVRSFEQVDTNHDELYVYVVDFRTRVYDKPTTASKYTSVPLLDWSLAKQVDIDNIVIRTGDGNNE